jgi:Na+/H+-dicarboxylate symporter
MDDSISQDNSSAGAPRGGLKLLARWQSIPLYWRIIAAMALGALTGVLLKQHAGPLAVPADLVIRLLGALAPPLILLAVMQALIRARIPGRMAARMAYLLALNTIVAICIGLAVANIIKPGSRVPPDSRAPPPAPAKRSDAEKSQWEQMRDQVPDSLLKPLVDNNVIGVIFVAVAFGIALRRHRDTRPQTIADWVDVCFDAIIVVLHWVIALVPLAVFGKVASVVGTKGFEPFKALGAFVVAVVIGLFLQSIWYLVRIYYRSWVRPIDLIRGSRDALAMAFSTDSSTATMPVTYAVLVNKVGLREESARMGALIGTNFNNDGTALYEAMSALFIAQLVGRDLSLGQQLVVMLMSIVASVGAAGIPEAGTVTMLLVLSVVRLPTEYVALLLTVDWFLDRCRTAVNVMGDMNVSCMLEGIRRNEVAAADGRNELPSTPPKATHPSQPAVQPRASATENRN